MVRVLAVPQTTTSSTGGHPLRTPARRAQSTLARRARTTCSAGGKATSQRTIAPPQLVAWFCTSESTLASRFRASRTEQPPISTRGIGCLSRSRRRAGRAAVMNELESNCATGDHSQHVRQLFAWRPRRPWGSFGPRPHRHAVTSVAGVLEDPDSGVAVGGEDVLLSVRVLVHLDAPEVV